MKKLITVTMAVLMVGLFAAVVYAAVGAGDDSSSTVGTTETSPTTETTQTTTTPDDRGRHHNRGRERHRDDSPAGGVDISGPCDEAEHANDPRCTGVQTGGQGEVERNDDNDHGRHGDDDANDDHGDDDNSGPGNAAEDHSGSGHGGDDESDDSGDDHGGNSGHGGGDDD
ncbi:MAG: hypothetical protein QOI45_656 [Thermoleophilaceae bacterium]|nr:hypothetical protein [Thermoleophilaceae bacterium]